MAIKPVSQNEAQIQDEMFIRFFQLIGQAVDSKLFNLCVVALFAWLFYQKTSLLEAKIDNCQSEKIEYYRNSTERMLNAFESNTAALKELGVEIKTKKLKP